MYENLLLIPYDMNENNNLIKWDFHLVSRATRYSLFSRLYSPFAFFLKLTEQLTISTFDRFHDNIDFFSNEIVHINPIHDRFKKK